MYQKQNLTVHWKFIQKTRLSGKSLIDTKVNKQTLRYSSWAFQFFEGLGVVAYSTLRTY